jgi:hypothetical protein
VKHVASIDGLGLTGHMPAIAEPAALSTGRRTHYHCRKKTYNGITIALTREGFSWSESAPEVR